jgi:hypothetical protein
VEAPVSCVIDCYAKKGEGGEAGEQEGTGDPLGVGCVETVVEGGGWWGEVGWGDGDGDIEGCEVGEGGVGDECEELVEGW